MYRMTDVKFKTFCERVIIAENGCIEWIAGKCNGYGQVMFGGRVDYAHRLSYMYFVGEIPESMELDHLCRNRPCVSIEHLEVVTPRVNNLRCNGAAAINYRKTHCNNGHEYIDYNLIIDSQGARQCRKCRNERWLRNHYRRNSSPN